MTGELSPSLSWVMDFQPLFDSRVDLVLEPRSDNPAAPQFHYGDQLPKPRIILLQGHDDSNEAWSRDLASELQRTDWKFCLMNLIGIPLRSLRSTIDGERLLDGAAFLAEVLRNTPKGGNGKRHSTFQVMHPALKSFRSILINYQ